MHTSSYLCVNYTYLFLDATSRMNRRREHATARLHFGRNIELMIYHVIRMRQSFAESAHLILLSDNVVNDRVKEDAANADCTSKELDGIQRLSEHNGDPDNDNDALSGISDGLSDGTGLFERHGGEFIVAIEPKARGDQVGRDDGIGFEGVDELSHLVSLLSDDNRDRHKGSQYSGDGELVSDGSQTIFEAVGLHELLVLVALERGEHVSDAGGYKGGDGEIELLDRGKNDSTNDDGEAEPLGLGYLFFVDELG